MKNKVLDKFKLAIAWWLIMLLVVLVDSNLMHHGMLIFNSIVVTLVFVSLVIGIFIGAGDSKVSNSINLVEPKVEPSEPVVRLADTSILLYEAYVEFKGGADSLIVCAKDKETGKRLLIEKYPFGRILFFTPLKLNKEFAFVTNNPIYDD
jgi:hypothetical protein